ncbi:hypothetical protein ABT373_20045 [Streptomyces sp. NPDC000070]|uniref:hypothetical protein n=1 Tax=Streptomyces sp. NPDC000070 TaxID=3154240 RepID=UPI00331E6653
MCDSVGWAISGITVTVLGVVLTAHGILRTLDRFEGRRAIREWLLLGWRTVSSKFRRAAAWIPWRQRRREHVRAFPEAAEVVISVDTETVRKGLPQGPAEQQTAWLAEQLHRIEEAAVSEKAAREAADEVRQQKLAAQLKEYEDSIRDTATGEVPKQFIGLLLITVGTLLLAVPGFC